MNEDFAPFELAVKLKEKGFNKECLLHYTSSGGFFSNSIDTYDRPNQELDYSDFQRCYNNGNSIGLIDAPTISQVLKWLREEQGYNVNMRIYSPDGWYWTIQDRDGNYCCSYLTLSDDLFETYEQAALAGIEYVLDNLI